MKVKIKLKQAMKEKGITQMQLSEIANVRQAAISELCRNARTEINLDMLSRIAEALEIKDISQLLEFEE
ncbi:helix-turn-helix transcriptional regulator [Paenibacillus sp. FSL R7-0216]|uniref:helix-turn-helix domain-containing protein n=1 Tax=Paenibacillus sp. FSL R7-0216 TaxID=2921677 RepID=UPI0030D7CAB3